MSASASRKASTARPSQGGVVWFTGLSGAGKSTLARAVLASLGRLDPTLPTELLDADQVRAYLSSGLGFSRQDREENVRRLGYVASLLSRHGVLVLVAAISPYRDGRRALRQQIHPFLEVFVDAPLAVCEQRDPIGLYRRFRAGEIRNLSGLDSPYEAPEAPDVHCRTAQEPLDVCVDRVVEAVRSRLDRQCPVQLP